MGKRSNFIRRERDYYATPREAVVPLLPHLTGVVKYYEPCAGDGRLITHLLPHTCVGASDIEPQSPVVIRRDIFELNDVLDADYIITNPPWDRKLLHPIIEICAHMRPTWLLFDADWMHTAQSKPYMAYCGAIVSVGRVRWIENSKMTGKDNCCWYHFDAKNPVKTVFYGR